MFRRRWTPHGGGERFVDAYLAVLVRAGHEVHLYAEAWSRPVDGVSVHRVPTLRAGSALDTLTYACLAPRLAAAGRSDLVHSFERTLRQDLYRAGEGCHRQWLELRRRYAPRVRRRADALRPFHRVVLAIERRICRGGARLLAVTSSLVGQAFARHYAPLDAAVVLLRNAVDPERFHPDVRAALRARARAGLGVTGGDRVLLTLGSGFERKGVPTLVRALGRLKAVARVLPLALVAGDGDAASMRRLAQAEGVEARVRFLGPVDDPRPLYAAADLFVLPTLYDPSSNATLEAMAMGLPVITTATNGSAELLEPGRSGWVLERPDDAAGLARLIDESTAADLRAVGEAGRRAVEPHTWARYLDDTLGLYRRLADQG
ncbi:MAG TPA: glycosyltransferase family 4 protein [Candidatus Binatia bacterium]|nr:glycosyltransferase family 4 protein [Candidatus Binatia bacterium]